MKNILSYLILLIVGYNFLLADPLTKESMHQIRNIGLFYSHSDLYNNQLEVDIMWGGKGFIKNLYVKDLELALGLRYENNNYKATGKFVLWEHQGYMQSTLLSNNKNDLYSREEYIFNQFGFKLFEYSQHDFLNNDFSFLRFNADFIFEKRKFSEFFSQNFLLPGKYNPYFIISPYIGLTSLYLTPTTSLDSHKDLRKKITGADIGFNCELGFELTRIDTIPHIDNVNKHYYSFFESKYAISIIFENRFIISGDLILLNYGIKMYSNIHIESLNSPWIDILFTRREMIYHNVKNSCYSIDIETHFNF